MTSKQDFKNWLKLDSGDGDCVMEKLLHFYGFVEDYFKSEQIEIKIPYDIALIKFCWFFFINSNNKTYKNPANHMNNTEHDEIIENVYIELYDMCKSAAFPFLYHSNKDMHFEFNQMIKELI